ncbi:hypothetical protein ACIQFU_36475 [Streptomyces sp. NPDC093065]|uniref:hypothetical protein n=1 Tax=Streptomyces sp. NPDC093065 TaxID=3366021 RepID=UPI00381848B0
MNEVPVSSADSTMTDARSVLSSPASTWAPSHWCRFCGMYSRKSAALAEARWRAWIRLRTCGAPAQ